MPSEGVTLFLLMVNVGNSNDHPRGATKTLVSFSVCLAVGWSKSRDFFRISRNLSRKRGKFGNFSFTSF